MSRRLSTILALSLCILTLLSCRAESDEHAAPSGIDTESADTPTPRADTPSPAQPKDLRAGRLPNAPRPVARDATQAPQKQTATTDPSPNDASAAPSPPDAQEPEQTRQFQFDGSDEELEMILGQRPIPPFYIDDLLTIEDLRSGLGPHTPTQIGHLSGQEASPFYNQKWFRSAKDDRMGVVFQYWHFQTPTAASTHYALMEKTAVSKPQPVGAASQAFYSAHDHTTALVALSLDLSAVIALTCDVEMCHVPQLMRWVKLIESRVKP